MQTVSGGRNHHYLAASARVRRVVVGQPSAFSAPALPARTLACPPTVSGASRALKTLTAAELSAAVHLCAASCPFLLTDIFGGGGGAEVGRQRARIYLIIVPSCYHARWVWPPPPRRGGALIELGAGHGRPLIYIYI